MIRYHDEIHDTYVVLLLVLKEPIVREVDESTTTLVLLWLLT